MKACAIFNEAFPTFRVASSPSLEIAQRFNAGFRLRESRKSRQGRQTRACSLAFLSPLKGLWQFCAMIFPALKRWAIFGSKDGPQRDSLRIVS
jgi:hypothetical protein